mmetsp:Transcript_62660/g.151124  ORF Transcript_62660/g.151124 Transcript_62660/m.151124 type:complete len:232 (-) Transcript_62660:58-753(-)
MHPVEHLGQQQVLLLHVARQPAQVLVRVVLLGAARRRRRGGVLGQVALVDALLVLGELHAQVVQHELEAALPQEGHVLLEAALALRVGRTREVELLELRPRVVRAVLVGRLGRQRGLRRAAPLEELADAREDAPLERAVDAQLRQAVEQRPDARAERRALEHERPVRVAVLLLVEHHAQHGVGRLAHLQHTHRLGPHRHHLLALVAVARAARRPRARDQELDERLREQRLL